MLSAPTADGVTFNGGEALTLKKPANHTLRLKALENTELAQKHADVTQLLFIYELLAPVFNAS